MVSAIIGTICEKKAYLLISQRVQGGGSVMIWAAFKKNQKSEIVFEKCRMNGSGYQQMLHDHLLSYITLK